MAMFVFRQTAGTKPASRVFIPDVMCAAHRVAAIFRPIVWSTTVTGVARRALAKFLWPAAVVAAPCVNGGGSLRGRRDSSFPSGDADRASITRELNCHMMATTILGNLLYIACAAEMFGPKCDVVKGHWVMVHVAQGDWTFEHFQTHHLDTPPDIHTDLVADTAQLHQTDSVASVLKNLWHHADLMNGGSSSAQAPTSASSAGGSSKAVAPTLTVANSAVTVDAGGSVALPINVSSGSDHATKVTISGLASYESLTDNLDHKTFTGDTITLSAAEVNSGLSLASNYTGTDHPVNTLTVTASETIGHQTLTSESQAITVTDPPTSAGSGLTLQVSGDMYKGDPKIQVFVDGHQVGGTFDITAHHSLGQTQTI